MSSKNYKDYYSDHYELHTPRVDITFSPNVSRYMELQCNSDTVMYTNMPEATHISEFFDHKPTNVMEIGGGIGRGSAYLAKRFNWDNTHFYMLDGNSGDAQICPIDGQRTKDFYNSFDATTTFLTDNDIKDSHIHLLDANNPTWENDLPKVKMDYIYSFLSIGYHWSIGLYLERLKPFCHENTILFFGMRGTDRGDKFARKQAKLLKKDPYYKILENYRDSELHRSSILVIGKNSEPRQKKSMMQRLGFLK